MKNFILPITILIAFLYLASSQLTQSRFIYNEGNDNLAAKKSEIKTLESSARAKTSELTKMRKDSILKEAMLLRWDAELVNDSFNVNRELDNIISKYGCLPSNSSNSSETLRFDGKDVPIHTYRTTILGDFKSVLAVIGAIEQKYPTSMISELIMSESISGVTCKLSVAIPSLKSVDNG